MYYEGRFTLLYAERAIRLAVIVLVDTSDGTERQIYALPANCISVCIKEYTDAQRG